MSQFAMRRTRLITIPIIRLADPGERHNEEGSTMHLISTLFGLYLHQAYVRVPDGYQIDLEREPPAYAIPRDRSNIVKLEIPTGHLLSDGKLVLRYDSEMRSIAPSGNAIILRMQWDFD